MNPLKKLTALVVRPHLPRRTIRLRLTAIYSGLFLLCGVVLLAITYTLVDHAPASSFSSAGPGGVGGSSATGHGQAPTGSGSAPSLHSSSSQPAPTPHQLQALTASYHANELHQLLIYSAIALAIMVALSMVAGWLVAGRVLHPLRTITTAARDISATNLHRRLSLAGPDDELKELGNTFDDLLSRLESFVTAQRQFVANASHELRTPLAWQRTLVQVALDDPDADMASREVTLERVLASGSQQERLIEALLALARSQAGLDKREPLDLAALVAEAVAARSDSARRQGIEIRTALTAATITGDPRLIERLIANLIDNALRYNTIPGSIDITTATADGKAVLSIANTGPVVPPADTDRLLQPFQRNGTERTGHNDGLGLGLSIVSAIVNAHRADLHIHPDPAGGLHVETRFPSGAAQSLQPGSIQDPAVQPGR